MAEVKAQADLLRHELKGWEKHFAAQNEGRKPERDDIKLNPTVAAKYKEHGRLSDILSGKSQPSLKRKASDTHGPNKRISTPRKGLATIQDVSPGQENDTPRAKRAYVDPTPQKDGRVLSIFDSLPDTDNTPSRPPHRTALSTQDPNTIPATPSRAKVSLSAHESTADAFAIGCTPITTHKHARTPQSSTKRFLLDTFLTPSKRQKLDDASTPCAPRTLLGSNTPAFLSRYASTLAPVAENDMSTATPTITRVFKPRGAMRRGLTRSLSTMIADMRQAEEDKLDQEMDILREIEEEAMGGDVGASELKKSAVASRAQEKQTLRQAAIDSALLGPDGSRALSEDEGLKDNLGRDGKPLRVWKKKGQKRQTRRVILRPTTKPQTRPTEAVPDVPASLDGEDSQTHAAAASQMKTRQRAQTSKVADSPTIAAADLSDADGSDALADSDFDALHVDADNASDDDAAGMDSPKKKTTPRLAEPGAVPKAGEKESFVTKAVKKVKAAAHENYRRLKIRSSKGAKATTAGKGRFGRRK